MDIIQTTIEECLRCSWLKPDPRFVDELKQVEKKAGAQSEITAKIRKIAYRLHIPKNLFEDAIQEGWLAHLQGKRIQSALNKWWKKEKVHYQQEHSVDPELIEVGVFGGFHPEDLGLHYDQYRGWCSDDI